MPSKGVTVWSFISVDDCVIKFSVPEIEAVHDQSNNLQYRDLEVESSNIPGTFNFTGVFRWSVEFGGQQIATRYNEINSLDGNVTQGDMRWIIDTESILVADKNLIISYGFYTAGSGKFGMPNHHLCYVTVTERQPGWMGKLAAPGSEEAQKPFSRFALAAPHDNGMNQMQVVNAVLKTVDVDDKVKDMFFDRFKAVTPLEDLAKTAASANALSNIAFALAFTQKDSITTMLDMGARYFEFRPAYLVPIFQQLTQLPDVPYFTHSFLPGIAYELFLEQIVQFLHANDTEIVVVHIRWDGVEDRCRRPTTEELETFMKAALSDSEITVGQQSDLSKSIETLRSSNTRIICVTEMDKYDSYSHTANATLVADPILESFSSMNTEGQEGKDLTVLQCQATPQAITDVVIYSVLNSDISTSPMLATKAMLDPKTLGWIRENAFENLKAEETLVVMNDFMDGATIDTTIELSRKRLAR